MRKDLIIIGAGDFAREVAWAAERMGCWNILGYVDDDIEKICQTVSGYKVLGNIELLKCNSKEIYATCAVGTGNTRKQIWSRLESNSNIKAATIIDPAAIIGNNCEIGEGSIICAGTVITVDTKLGKNCILNLNCTVGHDAILGDYFTAHPGTNISGKTQFDECVYLGTGSKVIQGLHITSNVTIGAGATVVKDITEAGTYVGTPAKRVIRN